jgi:hypothetical protein
MRLLPAATTTTCHPTPAELTRPFPTPGSTPTRALPPWMAALTPTAGPPAPELDTARRERFASTARAPLHRAAPRVASARGWSAIRRPPPVWSVSPTRIAARMRSAGATSAIPAFPATPIVIAARWPSSAMRPTASASSAMSSPIAPPQSSAPPTPRAAPTRARQLTLDASTAPPSSVARMTEARTPPPRAQLTKRASWANAGSAVG